MNVESRLPAQPYLSHMLRSFHIHNVQSDGWVSFGLELVWSQGEC